MDFPITNVLPLSIDTWSSPTTPFKLHSGASISTATNWTAGLAIYMPLVISHPYPVYRVFWMNGSSVTGNADFGIFTQKGSKIYSTGNTALSGTNVLQYASVGTPFILAPGSYFIGISCSSTGRLAYWNDVNGTRLCGCMSEASANPLPSTATFATLTAHGLVLAGITRKASL